MPAGTKFTYNGKTYTKYGHGSDGRVKDSRGKLSKLPTMTVVQEYKVEKKAPEVPDFEPVEDLSEPTKPEFDSF